MRRSILLIVGVSIFVIIGVCLASMIVLRTNAVDQTAIPPVTLKFSCNETPTNDDFQQFWSNFRGSVKTNDKDTLYSLTTRCEFVWWFWSRRGLNLRPTSELRAISSGRLPEPVLDRLASNPSLVFESPQDFDNNYPAIFSADTKQQILSGTLKKESDNLSIR